MRLAICVRASSLVDDEDDDEDADEELDEVVATTDTELSLRRKPRGLRRNEPSSNMNSQLGSMVQ